MCGYLDVTSLYASFFCTTDFSCFFCLVHVPFHFLLVLCSYFHIFSAFLALFLLCLFWLYFLTDRCDFSFHFIFNILIICALKLFCRRVISCLLELCLFSLTFIFLVAYHLIADFSMVCTTLYRFVGIFPSRLFPEMPFIP